MKKTKLKMIRPTYLGMSISDISKTLMYEFWYDYIKPKYQNNAKLCYMETDCFIIYIKIGGFYKDIENYIKNGLTHQIIKNDDKRPLPRGMNKKVIELMKDELGGNNMTELVAFRPKTYSYLKDDDSNDKKAEGTKKYIIKRTVTFNDYKDCLFMDEIILKLQQRFKSETHNESKMLSKFK